MTNYKTQEKRMAAYFITLSSDCLFVCLFDWGCFFFVFFRGFFLFVFFFLSFFFSFFLFFFWREGGGVVSVGYPQFLEILLIPVCKRK